MIPYLECAVHTPADGPIRQRPEPTDADIIAQLRTDLTEERAWSLRLAEYIVDVLCADVPDDKPVPAWEAHDFRTYWEEQAVADLKADDRWRILCWRRAPVPVMGWPESELVPRWPGPVILS